MQIFVDVEPAVSTKVGAASGAGSAPFAHVWVGPASLLRAGRTRQRRAAPTRRASLCGLAVAGRQHSRVPRWLLGGRPVDPNAGASVWPCVELFTGTPAGAALGPCVGGLAQCCILPGTSSAQQHARFSKGADGAAGGTLLLSANSTTKTFQNSDHVERCLLNADAAGEGRGLLGGRTMARICRIILRSKMCDRPLRDTRCARAPAAAPCSLSRARSCSRKPAGPDVAIGTSSRLAHMPTQQTLRDGRFARRCKLGLAL